MPEGGANDLAIKGCQEIIQASSHDFDVLVCAYATGSTFQGILAENKSKNKQVVGVMVLKTNPTEDFILDTEKLCYQHTNSHSQIYHTYHCGGYAKTTPALLQFVEHFNQTYQIPIEPIYTGKMFYALFDLIQKGYFQKGTRILAIHTGGVYEM